MSAVDFRLFHPIRGQGRVNPDLRLTPIRRRAIAFAIVPERPRVTPDLRVGVS